ncbi:hypothetical protein [Streptomyces sp. NBC_00439]|uniref:hypothetical protein n=1 Tax=Streptomyces sp. NBC_00439 TaxID=2903650 RepID=UPI00225910C9|nr:hypothetical protein [Streptomyces sp. NBC_00439]MCX5103551.1 hypothetical protein [Streptomyces sp. NBC_00439]
MSATEMQERAGRLAFEIWLSLLPHSLAVSGAPRRREIGSRPADAFRLTPVTDAAQLSPRDLVLALHNYGYETANRTIMSAYTVREAVRERESAVCLVASVNATDAMVHETINIPLGGWASCDPARFGQPRSQAILPARLRIPSASRTIARLGSLDDFLPALHEHPDYPAWLSVYAEVERHQNARLGHCGH